MPDLNVDNATLYYTVDGVGERSLVLLNGLIMTTAHWEPQLESFQDFTVVRYDQRNQGRSTTDTQSPCAVYSEDLLRLLDQLRIERATICGLSFGSAIAKHFAVHHPERCSGLVLVAPMREMDAPLQSVYSVWRALLETGRLREFVQSVATLSYARPWPSAVLENQEMGIDRFLKYNSAERVLALLRAFEASDVDDFGAVQVPTAVIAAGRDQVHDPSDASRIASEIPGCALRTIDGGHAINIDRPAEFNQTLAEFLDGLGLVAR